MDRERARRVIELLEQRGQLDAVAGDVRSAAGVCLERARRRHQAAALLLTAGLWDPAFTAAYDAYRSAADALVLYLGYRVPAVGAHRLVCDVAHAAVANVSGAFAPATAERFRRERHASEYFDPSNPVEKVQADATWAVALAEEAITAVGAAISDR
jgi:HEPN domain-containing protein